MSISHKWYFPQKCSFSHSLLLLELSPTALWPPTTTWTPTSQLTLNASYLNNTSHYDTFIRGIILKHTFSAYLWSSRILPKQNTTLLSHVSLLVTDVTSKLFSIIWWLRPCKPYISECISGPSCGSTMACETLSCTAFQWFATRARSKKYTGEWSYQLCFPQTVVEGMMHPPGIARS